MARTSRHGLVHAVTAVHARHDMGSSLVRCTSLRRAAHPGGLVSSRYAARFFAPTSQAVFFAHAGDRCVWHAGTPARG